MKPFFHMKKSFASDEMYIFSQKRKDLHIGKKFSSAELSKMIWLIREKGSGTRKITKQFFEEKNIKPKRLFTLGSTQIIKEAVETGLGISLMSSWVIKKELEQGIIQRLNVDHTPVVRTFSIIKLRQSFEAKSIRAFENLLNKS